MNRIKLGLAIAIVLGLLAVLLATSIGIGASTTNVAGLRIEESNETTALAASGTNTYQIVASADDVNQDGNALDATTGRVWLGNGASAGASYIGFRFRNVAVPKGATITSAKLRVYSTALQSNAINWELAAEAADNSAAFSGSNLPSQRPLTVQRNRLNTSVQWNDNSWISLDVTASVQEVINRSGWISGNKLSIIAHGLGNANQRRFVRSYDGNASLAPSLVIAYSTVTAATATPTTRPPQPATATAVSTVFLPIVTATPTKPTSSTTCNFTIGTGVTTADGIGNYSAVKPGNTVCIAAGNRAGLKLINFKGTAAAPIKFVNSGGKVNINVAGSNGGIGIALYGSQHVRLTGTGAANIQYGIEIGNASNSAVDTNRAGTGAKTDGTEYIELDHIYGHDVGAGFRTAKNNDLLDTGIVWSGHQFYIHDNYIKTTSGEAMYIGTSDTHGLFPIYDVQVWNNRIDDAGYDGIQIRQAHTKVLVHDNVINGTGRAPCKNGSIDNAAGFNIAKGTDTGDWYNNTIIGARTAFYIKDSENVRVYNNIVIDSGHATSGLSGPECPAGVTGTPPEGAVQVLNAKNVQFMFNTVVNRTVNAAYGISIKGGTGSVHDNIIGGTFTSLVTGTGMNMASNLENKDLTYFKFVSPTTNNWHLSSTSPSVNTASVSNMPTTDKDYYPRPQAGRSDVGAYEYH